MVYKVGLYHHFICPLNSPMRSIRGLPKHNEQTSLVHFIHRTRHHTQVFKLKTYCFLQYTTFHPYTLQTTQQFFEGSINYNVSVKAMDKRLPVQEDAGFSFPSRSSSLCLCTRCSQWQDVLSQRSSLVKTENRDLVHPGEEGCLGGQLGLDFTL